MCFKLVIIPRAPFGRFKQEDEAGGQKRTLIGEKYDFLFNPAFGVRFW